MRYQLETLKKKKKKVEEGSLYIYRIRHRDLLFLFLMIGSHNIEILPFQPRGAGQTKHNNNNHMHACNHVIDSGGCRLSRVGREEAELNSGLSFGSSVPLTSALGLGLGLGFNTLCLIDALIYTMQRLSG